MKLLSIAVFLWIYILTAPAYSNGVYPCGPSTEIKKVLQEADKLKPSARKAFLKEWLEKYPDDLFLHRSYQDTTGYLGAERQQLMSYYEQLSSKNPDNPVFLYLYGRSLGGLNTYEKSLELFTKSSELAPDFFYPHLALANRFASGSRKDPQKARKHWEAMMKLCPDEPIAYVVAAEILEPEEGRISAQKLRKLLEQNQNQVDYETLWDLELKSNPENHDSVKKKIRSDVNKMSRDDSLPVLLVRRTGYEYLTDLKALAEVEEKLMKLYPERDEVFELLSQRWDEQNPRPKDEEQLKEFYKKAYNVTKEWLKLRPEDPEIWLDYVSSMKDVPDAEFLAASEKLIELWNNRDTLSFIFPPIEFIVARLYVERGTALDRVPDLVAEASRSVQEEDKDHRQDFEWMADALLAETYLKSKKAKEAREFLERMQAVISAQKPAEGSDKQLQDSKSSEYWKLKAQLAELENQPLDALAFYASALENQRHTGKIRKRMAEIWKTLGGTDEGLAELIDRKTAATEPVEINKPLVHFQLKDIKGKTWRSEELKGKAVLINFWATWCGPCKTELPYLQKLFDRIKERKDIMLLTLNVDDNPGRLGTYMAKSKFTLPVLYASEYYDDFVTERGVPMSWFIDDKGNIRKEIVGFNHEETETWISQTLNDLEKLLKQ